MFSKLKSICALVSSVACVTLFVFACPDIISYFSSLFSTYVLNFISVLLAEYPIDGITSFNIYVLSAYTFCIVAFPS